MSLQSAHADPRMLTPLERGTLIALFLFLLLLGWWHLPPGVCYGDPGDLQAASTMLGIARPPGYAGYALAGWLGTKLLFFTEPAYAVSWLCLVCMAAALTLLAGLLTRVGLHVFAAAALAIALVRYPSVWRSLTAPQVYAPSLLLTASALYLTLRAEVLHRPRRLYAAAALLGLLIVDRPMTVLYVPGFVLAPWLLRRRDDVQDGGLKRSRVACTAVGIALLPVVLVVGLTCLLDAAHTPYNYIDQYATAYGRPARADETTHTDPELPPSGEPFAVAMPPRHAQPPIHEVPPGAPASESGQLARLRWLLTGEQFRYQMGASLGEMRLKLVWLRTQLALRHPAWPYGTSAVVEAGVYALLAYGSVRLWQRSAALLAAALAVGAGGVVYLLIYRVHSQSADLLPVLLAGGLLAGAALSASFPRRVCAGCARAGAHAQAAGRAEPGGVSPARGAAATAAAAPDVAAPGVAALGTAAAGVSAFPRRMSMRARTAMAALAAVLSAGWIATYAGQRYSYAAEADASGFLAELDLTTLPPDAVVLSDWGYSAPLRFARGIMTGRTDVEIVTATEGSWAVLAAARADRPVFYTAASAAPPEGRKLTPWRNVWRVE